MRTLTCLCAHCLLSALGTTDRTTGSVPEPVPNTELLFPEPGKGSGLSAEHVQSSHSIPRRAIPCWEPFLLGTNKPGSQVVSLDRLEGWVETGPASQEPCLRNFTLLPDRPRPSKRGQGSRRRLGQAPTSLGFCRVPAPSAGHWGTYQTFSRTEHRHKRCCGTTPAPRGS